ERVLRGVHRNAADDPRAERRLLDYWRRQYDSVLAAHLCVLPEAEAVGQIGRQGLPLRLADVGQLLVEGGEVLDDVRAALDALSDDSDTGAPGDARGHPDHELQPHQPLEPRPAERP